MVYETGNLFIADFAISGFFDLRAAGFIAYLRHFGCASNSC
jgi:hypothetical protein